MYSLVRNAPSHIPSLKYLEVAKYLAKSAKWKQYYNEMIDKLNGDFSPALVKYDVSPLPEPKFV